MKGITMESNQLLLIKIALKQIKLALLIISLMSLTSSMRLVAGQFTINAPGTGSSMGGLATFARPNADARSIGALSMLTLGAAGGAMGNGGGALGDQGVEARMPTLSISPTSGLTAAQSKFNNPLVNWNEADLDGFYELELEDMGGGMAPPDCYTNLIQNYINWHSNYTAMQKNAPQSVPHSAEDVVKEVFGKLEKSLVEEECPDGGLGSLAGPPNGFNNGDIGKGQKVDFIYKTLKLAIKQLDGYLSLYRKASGYVKDVFFAKDKDQPEFMDVPEQALRMLDRAKNRAIKTAKGKMRGKFDRMVQKKGIEVLSGLLTLGLGGDPMSYLEPMLWASNSRTIKTVVGTLTNLHFRGAILLINQDRPMDFMKCRDDNKPEPTC